MKAYNLADLERQLSDEGWSVIAESYVRPHDTPGLVNDGGYRVSLSAPSGATYTGDGPTRSDALRMAAANADLLEPEQPHLV